MRSTGDSSLYDERVSKFLTWYEKPKTQEQSKELATDTRKKCEELLKDIEGKEIKGVVQGRVKKYDSLEEKLDRLAQVSEFRDWVSGESLKKKLRDLQQDSNFENCVSEDLFQRLEALLQDSEFGSWTPGNSLKEKLGDLAQDSEFGDWVSGESLKKELRDLQQDSKFQDWASEDLLEKLEDLLQDSEFGSWAPGDSLKLGDLAQDSNFGDWFSEVDHISKYHEMGDLAGVRIGLYFPDDILKVVKKIKEHSSFEVVHLFGTVTGGRDVTKGKIKDIDNYLRGIWLDENNNDWEHYGYKSWQMVVEWKEPLLGRGAIQYHYKNPLNIRSTPTMTRMIDSINGLAITTDIMLRELKRSLEVVEKEAEERDQQPFKDGAEFLNWFKKEYMSRMKPKERRYWFLSQRSANRMVEKVKRLSDVNPGHTVPAPPQPCRTEFRKLIDEKGLLKLRPKTSDICGLLQQAILGDYIRERLYQEKESSTWQVCK
ncbi:uncharacterized protein PAC_20064 [Phialocephala subalpina]|uniref:Uncharacterized protein n=1 Tax=Phialocephala subalpina TaxID=576137 RepID=A0A1L7XYL3_9HELO|nr:uncharacterized protein PAC_20064 [Phialocephala subalpina]